MAYCQNMINLSATNAIHNIIINKRPECLINLYNTNTQRKSKQITTNYLPRTEQFNVYIYIKQYKCTMIY